MREFFDLIARRPLELLGATPRFFTRDLESLFKTEPEVFRPISLKLYETEEALIARVGFREYYDANTGRGHGAGESGGFTWPALVLEMAAEEHAS